MLLVCDPPLSGKAIKREKSREDGGRGAAVVESGQRRLAGEGTFEQSPELYLLRQILRRRA